MCTCKDPADGIPPKEPPSRPQTECQLELYEARPYTLSCLPWHHTRPLTHLPKPLPQDARKTLLQKQPLRKLHGTNWGACPHTMRTTATALCLSVAEYCCPLWARSTHRKLVDTTLNEICNLITGCIRPTATPDLYLLSGIAPPENGATFTARTSAPNN